MLNEETILNILLELSTKAYKKGEIPVSAIVVKDNKIISKCFNLKERKKDITAHAEVLAIRKAAKKNGNWNLSNCDLYVTLKPCCMCEEIIKQSRIRNVYYLIDKLGYKHDFDKTKFIMLEQNDTIDTYQQLLSNFFKNKR